MNIIVLFLVLFVLLPFVNRLLFFNPLLGILLYVLLIGVYISYIKRKKEMMYHAYHQQNNFTNDNTYQNTSNSKVKEDVIDVEFTEEEL